VTCALFIASLSAQCQVVQAQVVQAEIDEKSAFSISIGITHDSFFGLYPDVRGTYQLSDDFGLTFRGVYWSDVRGVPDGAAPPGKNPWTQIDAGVVWWTLDKRLLITAMIGTVHGQLLSSGELQTEGRSTAFEGFVPSLKADYVGDLFESGGFIEWYKSIRSEAPQPRGIPEVSAGAGTRDFMRYWVYGGYRVTRIFSTGVHWEHLMTTRDSAFPGARRDYFLWLGGYLEAKLPKETKIKFIAGKNFEDGGIFTGWPL
jgi:hypothetical protein